MCWFQMVRPSVESDGGRVSKVFEAAQTTVQIRSGSGSTVEYARGMHGSTRQDAPGEAGCCATSA